MEAVQTQDVRAISHRRTGINVRVHWDEETEEADWVL